MNAADYRRDIDGLRAVAVIMVVLFHAKLGFPGGFVGVDVFFVISGYLITNIIIRDLAAGKFSLVTFYDRRIRRILPPLITMVVLTLLAGWLLLLPEDLTDLAKSAMSQVGMSANIYFWRTTGYFEGPADQKPLLHMWSLAVEEQFYLLFPMFLLVFYRYSRQLTVVTLIFITVISMALSVYGTAYHPSAAYYLLPTRAWELSVGALLALATLPLPTSLFWSRILGAGGLAAILFSGLFYTKQTQFPGIAAALPCFGACAVIAAGHNSRCWPTLLLTAKPLVAVGLISYSLYLWHWPILVFGQYWAIEGLGPLIRGFLVLVSVGCGWLSWRYVESPFRTPRWNNSVRPRQVFAGAVTFNLLACVLFSCFLVPDIQPWLPKEAVVYAKATSDTAFLVEVNPQEAALGNFPRFGSGQRQKVDILVWGDSHAMAAMPVIADLCSRMDLAGAMATYSSTPPLIDFQWENEYGLGERTPGFADSVIGFVRENNVRHVFLIAVWENYRNASRTGAATGQFGPSLSKTISRLRDAGATVSVMLEVPLQNSVLIPRLLARQSFFRRDVSLVGVPILKHREHAFAVKDEVTKAIAGRGEILDPSESLVDSKGLCPAAMGGRSLYRDNYHLTVHGAMQLEPMFRPVLERIANRKTENSPETNDGMPQGSSTSPRVDQ